MSGSREMAAQLGDTGQAAITPKRSGAALGWWAAGAIIASLVVMVAASLLRLSWQPLVLIMPAAGPPWEITAHVSSKLIVVALWLAALVGAGGMVAGLLAARRGLPVPLRTLLIVGAAAVLVLIVLPPVGSTDSLDYAVYGHIVALGHSPYVMTPLGYRQLTGFRFSAPLVAAHNPSYYGPLATAEQFLAAKLSGTSIARTIFWLKLLNAIAFGAVAIAADRRFRSDRASRVRAHLLWTTNPLLIWTMIASAHLDVLAAAVGLAGLLIVDERLVTLGGVPAGRQRQRAWLLGLAAGACVGTAADIKIDYALFALAIAWALRRRLGQLLAAAVGFLVILLPSYAIAGLPAIKALAGRVSVGLNWEYWPLFDKLIPLHVVVPVAAGLMFPLAALALARMPTGLVIPSAIRAGLAFSLAWLLLWPHQFAWYSVMIFCVLLFYPASRVDWVVAASFTAMTIASMPGVDGAAPMVLGKTLERIDYQDLVHIDPAVLLCAVVAFVTLCITQRWHAGALPRGRAKLPFTWRRADLR
jgi:hypothetical protein